MSRDLVKQGEVPWDVLDILISPVPPTGENISPKMGLFGTYSNATRDLSLFLPHCSSGDGFALRAQCQVEFETFHSRGMMDVKTNIRSTSANEMFHFGFFAQGFLFPFRFTQASE